jgi:hypothetical protein
MKIEEHNSSIHNQFPRTILRAISGCENGWPNKIGEKFISKGRGENGY